MSRLVSKESIHVLLVNISNFTHKSDIPFFKSVTSSLTPSLVTKSAQAKGSPCLPLASPLIYLILCGLSGHGGTVHPNPCQIGGLRFYVFFRVLLGFSVLLRKTRLQWLPEDGLSNPVQVVLLARRLPGYLLPQGLIGSNEGGAMTTTRPWLAQVPVVVARWSTELDVIFTSNVLCTALTNDK